MYLENTWNIFWFRSIYISLRDRTDMKQLAKHDASNITACSLSIETNQLTINQQYKPQKTYKQIKSQIKS